MMFKAKSAKSTVTPLLILTLVGGQNLKSVNQYKYLRIVLDTKLSDDNRVPTNVD